MTANAKAKKRTAFVRRGRARESSTDAAGRRGKNVTEPFWVDDERRPGFPAHLQRA